MQQAGRLRNRVQIQAPTEGRDSYGQPVAAWSIVCERWAEVVPLSGQELWRAQQVQANVTHRVRLRYDEQTSNIRPKWRVLLNGRKFGLVAVIDVDERHREILLYCVEEV